MRSSARLTEGFTITLENLPGLWAEDAGVVQTPLHLDPIAPPRTPRRFVVKIQTGQQPVAWISSSSRARLTVGAPHGAGGSAG